MTETLQSFLANDDEKIDNIIKKYPISMPVSEAAELLGMSPQAVRSSIENGNLKGLCWKKPGSMNKGFSIPTASFLRWYTMN